MVTFQQSRYELSKEDELRFIEAFKKYQELTHPPIFATKKQDMYEGWDLMINQTKYDVKGRKSIHQGGRKQHKYFWIEIKNDNGNKGWLYSDHHTAVDLKDRWLVFKNTDLKMWVLKNIVRKVKPAPTQDHLYSSQNTHNLLTLMNTENIISNIPHIIV